MRDRSFVLCSSTTLDLVNAAAPAYCHRALHATAVREWSRLDQLSVVRSLSGQHLVACAVYIDSNEKVGTCRNKLLSHAFCRSRTDDATLDDVRELQELCEELLFLVAMRSRFAVISRHRHIRRLEHISMGIDEVRN